MDPTKTQLATSTAATARQRAHVGTQAICCFGFSKQKTHAYAQVFFFEILEVEQEGRDANLSEAFSLSMMAKEKGSGGKLPQSECWLSPSLRCIAKLLQSCPTLCDPMDCSPPGSSVHGNSPGKNTGVGFSCPPPGDLPDPGIQPVFLTSHLLTQESNPCFLHLISCIGGTLKISL